MRVTTHFPNEFREFPVDHQSGINKPIRYDNDMSKKPMKA